MTQPPPDPATLAAPPLPEGPKTSGLAVASLICGIAGLCTCGVGGLVGLVLGIVALVKIGQSQGQMGGQGLAIAGILVSALCMVLVVVAGPPLLGLLILFREEMKEEVLDAWDEANPPPADDFFGGDLMKGFHLPLPAGAAPEILAFPGTIVRRPS